MGILSHKLILNDSKVKIHEVYGTVLLITPGIFERYAHEFPDISQRAVQVMEE
nr:DNA-binding domain-containing protein [Pseudomonas sp. CFBP 13710]